MLKVFVFFFMVFSLPALAQRPSEAFRSTDYPLPRFVSTASDKVFVRSGPGRKYPVKWVLKKKALPVEIILEYDIWRKIRDVDGDEGWVHKSLLRGKRTGFAHAEGNIKLLRKQNNNSDVLAYIEPRSLLEVEECNSQWCRVNASGYKGWIQQKSIWGVYEREEFD